MSTSAVKWSEGLNNRLSIIIRRYIDQIKLAAYVYMAVSFITFFSYSSGVILYRCVYGSMFCVFLFNFVSYIFLLLCYVFFVMFMCSYCYVCSVLGILFHCVVLCTVCV